MRIADLLTEDMRVSPKEHLDIYVLKPGALMLQNGLESIIDTVSSQTILDRSIRISKDPRYKYDDNGLPLNIETIVNWIKIDSATVNFNEAMFSIDCRRVKATQELPKMNIDVEHGGSRLHLGIEAEWIREAVSETESYIRIAVSWKEFGHFLGSIRSATLKMK